MTMNRAISTMTLLLTALGAVAHSSYPEKPVRVVAPLLAGSGADTSASIVTKKLGDL
jgi:tripartite-type tricarboxylate transporter receptor subunit TctC